MSTKPIVPSNLRSIITDFTADLSIVFPEYAFMWSKWASATDAEYEKLHAHCLAIYPERFFDILYTNADIFKSDSKAEVSFLPDVNFRLLFNCEGVSEKTKTSIWKYLQLILFTVIGSVNDSKRFGDAANIFEAMDENELHEKMAETMESVSDFFKNMESDEDDAFGEGSNEATPEGSNEGFGKGEAEGNAFDTPTPDVSVDELSNVMSDILEGFSKMGSCDANAGTPSTDANAGTPSTDANAGTPSTDANEGSEGKDKKPGFKLPNPEILKEHLKTLLDGKLGKLAKEFTDEFTNDLKGFFDEEDEANMKSSKDVLAKLIKDPKKMVLILKKITTKLQEKMKRGDISQEELMAEMSGLMEKMKDMGGGADFADMLKGLAGTPFMKMFEKGLGGMGGKIDMNKLNQMTKQSGMKERLRKKMEQKKASQALAETQALAQAQVPLSVPSHEIIPVNNNQYVFKIGSEVQEKSGLKPPSAKASASIPSAKASASASGVPSPSPKPSPSAPLSEAELIALFSKKGKSGKKTK